MSRGERNKIPVRIFLGLALFFGSCNLFRDDIKNLLVSLEAVPPLLLLGEKTKVRCYLKPIIRNIRYHWSAEAGNILGRGPEITWQAPQEEGIYRVGVEIRRGRKLIGNAHGFIQVVTPETSEKWYPVTGWIIKDTVWKKEMYPWLVMGDIVVAPGVRLKIEPGAEIYFKSTHDSLGTKDTAEKESFLRDLPEILVYGSLEAVGKRSSPILFQSTGEVVKIKKEDGKIEEIFKKCGSQWGGVSFYEGGRGKIVYAVFSQAYWGVKCHQATVEIKNSWFEKNGLYDYAGGIYLRDTPAVIEGNWIGRNGSSWTGSDPTGGIGIKITGNKKVIIRNNFIKNNDKGVVILGGRNILLEKNTFEENIDSGIFLQKAQEVEIKDCEFTNNFYGVWSKEAHFLIRRCNFRFKYDTGALDTHLFAIFNQGSDIKIEEAGLYIFASPDKEPSPENDWLCFNLNLEGKIRAQPFENIGSNVEKVKKDFFGGGRR